MVKSTQPARKQLSAQEWELETLLSLDGHINEVGHRYWTKVEARRVDKSGTCPHGIKYSLTLHDSHNERIFGIDNAHAIRRIRGKGRRRSEPFDHLHQDNLVTVYEYTSASDLIEDFWDGVNSEFEKRGWELWQSE